MSVELSHSNGTRLSRGRTVFLVALIGGVFLIYAVYLFFLQIVNGSEYQSKARQVALRTVTIPAQRGEIYDRNYDTPLVTNIDSFALDIVPAELPREREDEILGTLAEILGTTKDRLLSKIPSNLRHGYQAVELASGLSFETIAFIAERIDEFPGITWHNKPIRNYLQGGSIAHVIGYVGDITREEIQILYNKGYDFGAVLGKSGIERQYDMVLRGKDGKLYRTVDVRGRRVDTGPQEEDPPTLGNDIVLTIDRRIQEVAEQALGNRIGSVVALRPGTGEVLALVSYPWYDANSFYSENSAASFTKLSLDPTFPFLNRAIQSHYSPASTFKVLLTTAVLEEQAFSKDQIVNCTGTYTIGDRVLNCHKKTGHGPLDLYGALAQSCNVYFATVGTEHLGIDIIADYARRFGLGERTGIDLPGEITGIVPNPQWKQKTYNSPWVGGDTVNVSIGQGYLAVTPIQIANMIAMIVNDGVVYRPHLVKEIRDPLSGQVIESIEPEVFRTTQLHPDTFAQVREAMRGVITDGTANVVITTKAVEVAGKTGTGEVGLDGNWHSWFAAYAPYGSTKIEDQVVVVVMVEAANDWEWWGPYAANIIFQAIYANQSFEESVNALNLQWLFRQR